MQVNENSVLTLSLAQCVTYLGWGDKKLKKSTAPSSTPSAIRRALVERANLLLPDGPSVASPVYPLRGPYNTIDRSSVAYALTVGIQHQVDATANSPNRIVPLVTQAAPTSAQAINESSTALLGNRHQASAAQQHMFGENADLKAENADLKANVEVGALNATYQKNMEKAANKQKSKPRGGFASQGEDPPTAAPERAVLATPVGNAPEEADSDQPLAVGSGTKKQ